MKTKDITPAEYAKLRGCTLQNIGKHIRNGNVTNLRYVIRIKNFGRFYLLEVPERINADTFKEDLIKYKTNKKELQKVIRQVKNKQEKRESKPYEFQKS